MPTENNLRQLININREYSHLKFRIRSTDVFLYYIILDIGNVFYLNKKN